VSHASDALFCKWVTDELATLPGIYAPPRGRLLLATHEGRPAGCVALKPRGDNVAELKRLYVRPAFRGHRIGEHLVRAVLAEARHIGYHRIVLDSHISMTAAHALYRDAGFKTVAAPSDFPERFKRVVVFMECELAAQPAI